MVTKSISELQAIATPNEGDLFEVASPDQSSASGYASGKMSAATIGDGILNKYMYPLAMPDMQTKTVIGAINTLLGNFAPVYDATATYAEDDVVTYNGQLYKANQDIDTAEAFDATHWDVTTVFQYVNDGKALIADAITDKGVQTSADDTFQTMADNIAQISGGGGGGGEVVVLAHSERDPECAENSSWTTSTFTLSEGDIVLFAVTHRGTLNTSGYTVLDTILANTTWSQRLTIMYYRASASEVRSFTISQSDGSKRLGVTCFHLIGADLSIADKRALLGNETLTLNIPDLTRPHAIFFSRAYNQEAIPSFSNQSLYTKYQNYNSSSRHFAYLCLGTEGISGSYPNVTITAQTSQSVALAVVYLS